jgi:hypothetical protein
MAVIHIPEAEAARDLGSLMKKVALGDEIIIDGTTSSARLVLEPKVRLRTVGEALAVLDALPGERAHMDADFARDIRSFRERHAGESLGQKWD